MQGRFLFATPITRVGLSGCLGVNLSFQLIFLLMHSTGSRRSLLKYLSYCDSHGPSGVCAIFTLAQPWDLPGIRGVNQQIDDFVSQSF